MNLLISELYSDKTIKHAELKDIENQQDFKSFEDACRLAASTVSSLNNLILIVLTKGD